MEGVSFYSCKEWGKNGHYIFKIINEGSFVTDKSITKAPNVGVVGGSHVPALLLARVMPVHVR